MLELLKHLTRNVCADLWVKARTEEDETARMTDMMTMTPTGQSVIRAQKEGVDVRIATKILIVHGIGQKIIRRIREGAVQRATAGDIIKIVMKAREMAIRVLNAQGTDRETDLKIHGTNGPTEKVVDITVVVMIEMTTQTLSGSIEPIAHELTTKVIWNPRESESAQRERKKEDLVDTARAHVQNL